MPRRPRSEATRARSTFSAKRRAALARVSGIDPEIDAIAARLGEASALIDDASGAARAYRDAVEHDPEALDAALSRASVLAGLKRTYGPRLGDVLDARDAARMALGECEDFEQAIDAGRRGVEDQRVRAARRSGAALGGSDGGGTPLRGGAAARPPPIWR